MAAPPTAFVDTVALLALANRDDGLHDAAQRVLAELSSARTLFVTSDWVLAEFLGGASRRPIRKAACAITDRLRKSDSTLIVPASRGAWSRGYELYTSRQDKDWSFVDCSSILICQGQGIRHIFTQDRHFLQAGFEILLMPA